MPGGRCSHSPSRLACWRSSRSTAGSRGSGISTYTPHNGWARARGEWWARGLLHTGGRWVVRGVAASALVLWALSFVVAPLREWRRSAGFVLLAMLLATLIVGGLKAVTNVDCPWDLAGFGGHNPYVMLFADRPDVLRRAQCFPGAHASSGFALLLFLLRIPRSLAPRWRAGCWRRRSPSASRSR